jgi:hypothetical protein
MFDTAKSLTALKKIKNGGEAKLSYSQIINLIINMGSVLKRLPSDQRNAISDKYDYYRKMKQKHMMDLDGYCEACSEIIADLDSIAPYDQYCCCGADELELNILYNIREKI